MRGLPRSTPEAQGIPSTAIAVGIAIHEGLLTLNDRPVAR